MLVVAILPLQPVLSLLSSDGGTGSEPLFITVISKSRVFVIPSYLYETLMDLSSSESVVLLTVTLFVTSSFVLSE